MEQFKIYIEKYSSVPELAQAVNKTEQYLYMILRGERKPSLKLAFAIERQSKGKVPVSVWKN